MNILECIFIFLNFRYLGAWQYVSLVGARGNHRWAEIFFMKALARQRDLFLVYLVEQGLF